MAKGKSFEESIGELELDEALKLFDRGIKLSKSCQDILDKAEQKVTVLTREEDGSISEEPLDSQEE